jgi:hypothetical protein
MTVFFDGQRGWPTAHKQKTPIKEWNSIMTCQEEENQLKHTHPLVTFTSSCRRFLATAEVVYDTTNPWLKGGRAKDIIESSQTVAEAIGAASANLIKHMSVAQVLLGLQSDAPHEYGGLSLKERHEAEDLAKLKLGTTAHELMSLVNRSARKTVDHIRSVRTIPLNWAKHEVKRDVDRLAFVIQSLDYTRWQILKEFAKLVIIFDDHDDPDSDEPSEGWQKDQLVMGSE